MKYLRFFFFMFVANLGFSDRVVIFDFGDVLTGKPNREIVVQFLCDSFQLSSEEFEGVNQSKKKALKSGMSDEDFWLLYAANQGIELPENWVSQFKEVLKDSIGVNPRMFSLVDELKNREIRVGLLSNIDERLAKWMREFGFYEPFDPCFLSCELNLQKPDPKIYQFLIDKLELGPEKIVFIDDKRVNVEAAAQLGIDAIVFESEEQLRNELTIRGLLD